MSFGCAAYSFREDENIFNSKFEKLWSLIESSSNMTVFTGAGVSTLSGIPDFRGVHGVYNDPWMGMDVEEIISMTFFRNKPEIFYKWAKDVWYCLEDYKPNVVHNCLTLLQKKGYLKSIYTQNIDMLHQRSGSKNVYEVHGSPEFHHCTKCHKVFGYDEIAPLVRNGVLPICPDCNGVIKPDIIFYEEALNGDILNSAFRDFSNTDLCMVLGSSLTVQPAASFPVIARQNGAKVVIVNAQETYQDDSAHLLFSDLYQTCSAIIEKLKD